MRTDRELIDFVRAQLQVSRSLGADEAARAVELLELGRDVATIDAHAVKRGTNVPQVQRGLRGHDHQRQWELFLSEPDGTRSRYVQASPAAVRAIAATGLRLKEPK